ncbi:unnamed protein product [Mytilus edulis]|uniref:Replicase polyprotein 1a n=1 Tax=Mytilus edulis TaxID=6550 RepID=A0A8S3PVD2_MYTED|nr:unnamed protein product [Mytilus edulis]
MPGVTKKDIIASFDRFSRERKHKLQEKENGREAVGNRLTKMDGIDENVNSEESDEGIQTSQNMRRKRRAITDSDSDSESENNTVKEKRNKYQNTEHYGDKYHSMRLSDSSEESFSVDVKSSDDYDDKNDGNNNDDDHNVDDDNYEDGDDDDDIYDDNNDHDYNPDENNDIYDDDDDYDYNSDDDNDIHADDDDKDITCADDDDDDDDDVDDDDDNDDDVDDDDDDDNDDNDEYEDDDYDDDDDDDHDDDHNDDDDDDFDVDTVDDEVGNQKYKEKTKKGAKTNSLQIDVNNEVPKGEMSIFSLDVHKVNGLANVKSEAQLLKTLVKAVTKMKCVKHEALKKRKCEPFLIAYFYYKTERDINSTADSINRHRKLKDRQAFIPGSRKTGNILTYYRIKTSIEQKHTPEVYFLCNGEGYHAILHLCDTSFRSKIAKKFIDGNRIKEIETLNIAGPDVTSKKYL